MIVEHEGARFVVHGHDSHGNLWCEDCAAFEPFDQWLECARTVPITKRVEPAKTYTLVRAREEDEEPVRKKNFRLEDIQTKTIGFVDTPAVEGSEFLLKRLFADLSG